ncbi:hypothetical protein QJQ45_029146, partial [Haematococcus lacustris]
LAHGGTSSPPPSRAADQGLLGASGQGGAPTRLPAAPDSREGRLLTAATLLVEQLQAQGHLAFIAGGWVRDALLGQPCADIDIATSAPLDAVWLKQNVSNVRQLVHMPRNMVRITVGGEQQLEQEFEVAQFRGYRKDPSLAAASMDARKGRGGGGARDLRDFTINSLFYDPFTQQVLDFTGGVKHLQDKVLVVPPHPLGHLSSVVLQEDPLRVLRAVRFCTALDLRLEPDTHAALSRWAHRCTFYDASGNASLGPRRVHKELMKIGTLGNSLGPQALPYAFRLAHELGLLAALFPFLTQVSGRRGPHQPSSGPKPRTTTQRGHRPVVRVATQLQGCGALSPAEVARLQAALPSSCPLELRLTALVNPWLQDASPSQQLAELAGLLGARDAAGVGWDVRLVDLAEEAMRSLQQLYAEPGAGQGEGTEQLLALASQDAKLQEVLGHQLCICTLAAAQLATHQHRVLASITHTGSSFDAARKDPKAIWDLSEVGDLVEDDVDDGRAVPEYEFMYKQAVGSADVYLGMSGKDESSGSCEDLVMKISLPAMNTMAELDLEVKSNYIKLNATA